MLSVSVSVAVLGPSTTDRSDAGSVRPAALTQVESSTWRVGARIGPVGAVPDVDTSDRWLGTAVTVAAVAGALVVRVVSSRGTPERPGSASVDVTRPRGPPAATFA